MTGQERNDVINGIINRAIAEVIGTCAMEGGVTSAVKVTIEITRQDTKTWASPLHYMGRYKA